MSQRTQLSDESTAVTRREFTLEAALALLAGCVITVSDIACGDDNSNANPANPSPTPADISGSVSANHGHIATVTAAQITATNAVVLNIQGQATHNHTVSLSQADLQTLKNRQAVSRDSSNDSGHMHTVTFTPA
jgi:hypothetical protein